MHWQKSWNEACCQSEGEFASLGEIFHIPDSLPHHLTGKTGAKAKRDRTTPWPGWPSCAIPLNPLLKPIFHVRTLEEARQGLGMGEVNRSLCPFSQRDYIE